MKKTMFTTALLAGAVALGLTGNAWADGHNPQVGAVVTTADGQTYETIPLHQTDNVTENGPFQVLDASDGLTTEFGPGDPGYVPRWEINGTYFVCPLLGKPLDDV